MNKSIILIEIKKIACFIIMKNWKIFVLPNVAAAVSSISPILCYGCAGRREEEKGEEISKGKKGDVKEIQTDKEEEQKEGERARGLRLPWMDPLFVTSGCRTRKKKKRKRSRKRKRRGRNRKKGGKERALRLPWVLPTWKRRRELKENVGTLNHLINKREGLC